MNAVDFITVAGRWAAGRSPDEATCRSAVSRAYYGAFHLAKKLLSECIGEDVEISHGEVRRLLSCGSQDANKASGLLGDLQTSRIKADYRLQQLDFGQPRIARLAVEQANTVANYIRTCSQEPARAELKAGVAAYRQKLEK